MNMNQMGERPWVLRRMRKLVVQFAVLALVVAMVSPARAADDRAIKSRVAPVYPEIAKRMKIAGAVKVEATVDPEGKVTDAKAVSGNRILSTAAEDAVRRWKFEPGASVSMVSVDINFNLGQ
jgi:TonB family protein